MRAVILITAPAKRSGDVVEKLRNLPEVVEAGAVFGDTDVFAVVDTPNLEGLDRLIMDQIQTIEEVTTTRTHILIPSLHWTR